MVYAVSYTHLHRCILLKVLLLHCLDIFDPQFLLPSVDLLLFLLALALLRSVTFHVHVDVVVQLHRLTVDVRVFLVVLPVLSFAVLSLLFALVFLDQHCVFWYDQLFSSLFANLLI